MCDAEDRRRISTSDARLADEMLEKCYLVWCESGGEGVPDRRICTDMNLTGWEYRRIRAILDRESLTEEGGNEHVIVLTEKGIDHAVRFIRRKNYVSAFLKSTCNLSEESAERNAAAISESVSEDVLEGIRSYMMHGQSASRIIRDQDLNVLYEPGQYRFDVCIYEAHRDTPRILSEENRSFSPDTELTVTAAGSSFTMKCAQSENSGALWYLYGQRWCEAKRDPGGCRIPSHIFTYIVNGRIPVISGKAFAAFVPEGGVLKEEMIRELEVHLW